MARVAVRIRADYFFSQRDEPRRMSHRRVIIMTKTNADFWPRIQAIGYHSITEFKVAHGMQCTHEMAPGDAERIERALTTAESVQRVPTSTATR